MTTAPAYQPTTRRNWSWLAFTVGIVAGIIIGIVGLFGLGAVLFQDDVSAALEDEQTSTEVQTAAADLEECYGMNVYGCQSNNAFTMGTIRNTVGTPADDEDLERGLQLFDRGLSVSDEQGCATATEQSPVCWLAKSSMNAGVVMVREAAGVEN